MNKTRSLVRTAASATLALALAFGASLPAFAADVKLPNGAVWRGEVGAQVRATYTQGNREVTIEGTVVRIDKSLIVIEIDEGGRAVRRTIVNFDLKKLETIDAKTAAAGATAPGAGAATGSTAAGGASAATAEDKKVPNIIVLPWEGTVGIGARHDEIEEIGKYADKYGPGQIIVLLIDSPGGLVIEGDKIHETIKDLKKRHRVVAWIKKAISAGAFTALHCDEIYFMRVGALGAITMFAGTQSIQGAELAAWLEKVGEVCRMGGRPAVVGQAMVTNPIECSYDRDENGNITWYSTMEGKYDLSDATENLTLNAENAEHSKFSDGTADTVEELAKLLQLKEWREASDEGRRLHARWQRTIKEAMAAKPLLMNDYQNPAGSDPIVRAGNQIRAITEILKWYDRCYPVMVYEAPNLPPDKKILEEELERLKREVARMRKATR
ncbi:MAG: hypothetical protein GC172_10290 [Phycisphaera sp.]|nr:hypothetical protein [Phycisphaera sp.]